MLRDQKPTAECSRPVCALPIFFLTAGECLRPVWERLILARVSALMALPLFQGSLPCCIHSNNPSGHLHVMAACMPAFGLIPDVPLHKPLWMAPAVALEHEDC